MKHIYDDGEATFFEINSSAETIKIAKEKLINSKKFLLFTVDNNNKAMTTYRGMSKYDFEKFKEIVLKDIDKLIKIEENLNTVNKIIENKHE